MTEIDYLAEDKAYTQRLQKLYTYAGIVILLFLFYVSGAIPVQGGTSHNWGTETYDITIRYIIPADFSQDNAVFGISGNEVYRLQTYKIVLRENPLPRLEVSYVINGTANNLYFATPHYMFIRDYETGSEKFKLYPYTFGEHYIDFSLIGDYIYAVTDKHIERINVTSGYRDNVYNKDEGIQAMASILKIKTH